LLAWLQLLLPQVLQVMLLWLHLLSATCAGSEVLAASGAGAAGTCCRSALREAGNTRGMLH
jgi:hypothetical protein